MVIDRRLRQLVLRIRSIALGGRVEREMDEELQFHIDQQIAANVAAGMNEADARRAAGRAFGGLEQRKEEIRDTRRVSWLIDAVRDGRHALRLLARNPGFALAAVLSLGIGVGANVAMFSVVDALLLRKLPVPQPDGLWHFNIMTERPYRRDDLMFGMFERLQQSATSFSMMAGSRPIERANVTVDRPAGETPSTGMTRVGMVTADYFSTAPGIGCRPLDGTSVRLMPFVNGPGTLTWQIAAVSAYCAEIAIKRHVKVPDLFTNDK